VDFPDFWVAVFVGVVEVLLGFAVAKGNEFGFVVVVVVDFYNSVFDFVLDDDGVRRYGFGLLQAKEENHQCGHQYAVFHVVSSSKSVIFIIFLSF